MTRWGVILLVVYLLLGLSRTSRSKAMALGVGLTALVIGYELVKTLRT